ncbi:pilin [Vibrio cholerae]|nr:pilin [Vibrio mimicus]EGR1465332.1 pilin [Vibrio cholerae]EJL7015626.1 prepilin-type N-terminal cleavage/methylation domain-containing protein [Vibrio cholerae]EKF9755103.1 prepilin-type N-terminal cleavage/methylation domain-containing protein [Vibrio cholerae]ELJ8582443.1 prepilin-type N-terminal cleavage/methylation domain-containing protein [Vibrio cholerae]QXC57965.1 prepilin-type N-terminal cleavage/methylation domain-containing protein [Vibrio mimicus]
MKAYKNKQQQGFTLIELMIVVAIIGVLSAIAVPAYKDYVKKSEGASALATMKSLITASELWYQENGSFTAAKETEIFTHLGIDASSNPLGAIDIPADNKLEFKFGANSAVAQNTTITYERTETGWTCTTSIADIETDSCPHTAVTPPQETTP